MKSLSKRKTKQLRVFFRFLKDLGMFEQYRNIFFNKAEHLCEYDIFSKRSKHELLERLINNYIYEAPATLYTEIFFQHMEHDDFCAIKELWYKIVVEYRVKHIFEDNIFTDYEISKCEKYLNNIRRYERNCR